MYLWRPGKSGRATVDQVYTRLRAEIVNGTRPPGQVLRIGDVAKTYGVDRTTARDALQRIGYSGLLATAGGEATVVPEHDLDEAKDVQIVVAHMHRLALQLATPRFTRGDIATMRAENDRFAEAMRRGDLEEALAADLALHDIPVDVCGNRTIAAVLHQYQPIIERLERIRYSGTDVVQAYGEHADLIDLCEKGDADAAADLAEELWHSLRGAVAANFPQPVRSSVG